MARCDLKQDEIDAAFAAEDIRAKFPPILSAKGLARMLQRKLRTVRAWLSKGRFKGAARKRGKGYVIWRNRAILAFFNGPEWND